jgi:predicted transcriptional regulator
LKKALAASLLTILFTSQVGYYFIYTIHQYIIKEKIEKELLTNIPESSLEVFVAEELGNKIVWQEDNKEFSIDGVLYDVARIKRTDGKTFLYCINDKQEKQLLDNLAKAVNANHGNKQEKNNIKSLLLDLVCMNDEEEVRSFSVPSIYSCFNVTLVSSFEEINSPPPKA